MDDAGLGPYTWGDPEYISRPDVWRLLHLSPTEEDDLSYEYGPMTPWEPCGASLTTNCALHVTAHLKCPRHEYRYEHWSWELEGGETVQDYGFMKRYPSLSTTKLSNISDRKVASHSFVKKSLTPIERLLKKLIVSGYINQGDQIACKSSFAKVYSFTETNLLVILVIPT
ncbi:hypothetical protein BDV41DRAFT_329421 [Aspergillus transmontanensis]|uniref:Uncharacterized protein n=1 Tax=Aspergillus transmontanensis TaxID=1034304 RepID=A0A5N6WE55_9EURO|nr:hypothetical protein BDV41DRAFT_329421 [Aspergillus transmontanensis]